jgi:hypothetical protein
LDYEYNSIKQRDLPASLGLRVPEPMKKSILNIMEIKEKIAFLERTDDFYADLLEAYRKNIYNHDAHLKRLQDVAATYKHNNI